VPCKPHPPLLQPPRLTNDVAEERPARISRRQVPPIDPRSRIGNLSHHRERFQREIDATDRQIDHLVYELYGLTEEEIRIVEEATQ
jgi:hypothetical protein